MTSKFPINSRGVFSRLLLLTALLSSLLLTACSVMQTAQYYQLNDDEGLVFFSISQSGVLEAGYSLSFINEFDQKTTKITLTSAETVSAAVQASNQKNFASYDKPVGKLVVLRLPEGIYRFDRWAANNKKLGKYSLPQQPAKKFRVLAGHALYIGNIHLINSRDKSSLLIRDNRAKDITLFQQRYPRVEKDKLLISSKVFLDPAASRERLFNAYTNCSLDGYQLIAKQRLPKTVEKYRVLKVNETEKQVSRIDGYRLKYRSGSNGPVTLSMKVELSEISSYPEDQKIIADWAKDIKAKVEQFQVSSKNTGYFKEHQFITNVLDEKRMVYMTVMLDDVSQLVVSATFINPPEHLRQYSTVGAFIPEAQKVISSYQQCVLQSLNTSL